MLTCVAPFFIHTPDASTTQATLESRLQSQLRENSDAFLRAAEHIAQWGWQVNAQGTVPYQQ